MVALGGRLTTRDGMGLSGQSLSRQGHQKDPLCKNNPPAWIGATLEQKRAAFLADLSEAGGLDDLEVGHYNVGSAPQRRSELGQFTLKALIIIGCAFMVAAGIVAKQKCNNIPRYVALNFGRRLRASLSRP
jgi:hypothetical protein